MPLATDTRMEVLPNFMLEFLLLSLKPQLTTWSEGGITSSRMGASVCRGDEELVEAFPNLSAADRKGIPAPVEGQGSCL